MTLSLKSLVRLRQVPVGSAAGAAQAKQISIWLHATDEAAATVETAGFFNNARTLLAKGDIIISTMANGGTAVVKTYVAAAVPSTGNVTIAVQTATAG